MKLLLVNGNRTQAVTDAVLAEAQASARPDTQLVAINAPFGANIVSTAADNTIAAHAVLEALARHHRGFDAAILAISLDSGLVAARQLLPIPVLGITESACATACMLGDRFGMITFGRATRSLYLELATRYAAAARLWECRTLDASLSTYLDAGSMAIRIGTEARAIAESPDVGAVVICGAAMAGIARRIQPEVPVPLIDGVACAVRHAEQLVQAGYQPRASVAAAAGAQMEGIAPELAALFHSQRGPDNA